MALNASNHLASCLFESADTSDYNNAWSRAKYHVFAFLWHIGDNRTELGKSKTDSNSSLVIPSYFSRQCQEGDVVLQQVYTGPVLRSCKSCPVIPYMYPRRILHYSHPVFFHCEINLVIETLLASMEVGK